jgi:hypothetical protein
MARAVFHQIFHWSRPRSPFGFAAYPKVEVQTFPRDFIAAAVRAGAATEVPHRAAGKHGLTSPETGPAAIPDTRSFKAKLEIST